MNDIQIIQQKIYEIRGQRVMLDFDLAELYQVETRSLNQAVKRNINRFPDDFMFRLTSNELEIISSQFVMTSRAKRPKSFLPLAFTEHGALMLASVLRSDIVCQQKNNPNHSKSLLFIPIPAQKAAVQRIVEHFRFLAESEKLWFKRELTFFKNIAHSTTSSRLSAPRREAFWCPNKLSPSHISPFFLPSLHFSLEKIRGIRIYLYFCHRLG